MGWDFSAEHNKTSFVQDMLQDTGMYRVAARRLIGNHLWVITEYKETGEKSICLYLLRYSRDSGWGCKCIHESAHPYYYDCPLSLLDKVDPTKNKNAVEWRQKVREFHQKKNEKKQRMNTLEPGMRIRYDGQEYRLHSPAGARKGWQAVRCSDGLIFRIPARVLAEAEIVR